MRKTVISLAISVVIFLSGCSVVSAIKQKESIAESQSSIAEDVLNAVMSEDEELLFEMFSQENKNGCDIKGQIEELFKSIPVEDLSMDRMNQHENGGGTSYRDGRITENNFGYIFERIFDSNEQEYIISFGYCIVDDNNHGTEGLVSLLVARIKRNDPSNHNNYILVDEYHVGLDRYS